MGVNLGFGGWISQNTQQPPKVDSKRSENVESKSVSEGNTNNNAPAEKKVYYDVNEQMKQDQLWHDAEKKHPWYDSPPKVKVTTKKGLYHMNIEFTVGMTPDGVHDIFTNPSSSGFFDHDKWRHFMGKYKKEKMMFMKVFEGSWKIEPLYVDSERLCKQTVPKSREEYKKCSRGQGKVASKVTMNQYFQPYPLFNLPPLSWYIRGITLKTTKTLVKMVQNFATVIRMAETS
ncbi:unnamed protein product [Microthlaspi erraticum]|uniref:DUF220 domain-containing protein n=1 Tax=Microthlaspi erraticum TaxID=1685480 RepID=A0A6D2J3I0_9BRAS|nr:unnamed protein product [Microthlaspi erraticum]